MSGWRPYCLVHVGALLLWAQGCQSLEAIMPLEAEGTGEDSGVSGSGRDEDGDGLSDSREAELGTDPENPDSDDDAWNDGAEVEAGTNPLWGAHHPYEHGDYRLAACPDPPDTSGAGPTGTTQVKQDGTVYAHVVYEPGDLVRNETLVDEWGQSFELWGTCGLTIWIVVGPVGSEVLEQAAADIPSWMDQYGDYTWTPLVVLSADEDGGLLDTDDLRNWRQSFGLQGVPVVAPGSLARQKDLVAFDSNGVEPSAGIIGQDLRAMAIDRDIGLEGGTEVVDWLVD